MISTGRYPFAGTDRYIDFLLQSANIIEASNYRPLSGAVKLWGFEKRFECGI